MIVRASDSHPLDILSILAILNSLSRDIVISGVSLIGHISDLKTP